MPLNIVDSTDSHHIPIRTLVLDGTPLAVWTPIMPYIRLHHPFDSDGVYILSRFAYLRRAEEQCVLEHPDALVRIDFLDGRALALFGQLIGGLEVDQAFREFIVTAGFMDAVVSENAASRNRWSFHDRLFQAKTRTGGRRLQQPKYKVDAPADLPPVVIPLNPHATYIPLYKPDLAALTQTDPSFTAVLESRRTRYDYADTPITVNQLGEFLYRAARIQRVVQGSDYEGSLRPSAGAGALHELNLYIVAARCEGLEQDIYLYDPLRHQVGKLNTSFGFDDLLANATMMTGGQVSVPQVLIVITAQFDRINWKYPDTALSLVLKDVGVLYQTMYLVATAMGLAPCALGGGDAKLFNRIAELREHEQSVGEFLLGSSIQNL